MVGLMLLLVTAFAEPAPSEPTEVITVYKDREVEMARSALVKELKDAGYRRETRKDNYIRLRHDQTWKGEVRIYDDGWVVVRRQPFRLEAPAVGRVKSNSPLAWAACVLYPHMCINLYGPMVSKARFQAVETRTVRLMADRSLVLAEAVADAAINDASNLLPDRLEALWNDGQPLAGDAILRNYAQRRLALLHYWDGRTQTQWGDQIRDTVAAFIRAEVQRSDHPYIDSEIDVFRQSHTSHHALDFGKGVVVQGLKDKGE